MSAGSTSWTGCACNPPTFIRTAWRRRSLSNLHGGQARRLGTSRLPTGGPRDHPRAYFTYHGGVPFLPTASFNLLRENRCDSARTIQIVDEQDASAADGVAADVEGALKQVDPPVIERP